MQTLSSAEEQRLLAGIKTAVDLVDQHGFTPDAAITKVATDSQWSRGQVRAAVSAFNNGRQVAQWHANDDLMDKLAEFPLADYDKIHDALWGQRAAEKAASDRQGISAEYASPPTFVRDSYREMLLAQPLKSGFVKTAGDAPCCEACAKGLPCTCQKAKEAGDPWTMPRRAWEAQQREKRAYEQARNAYSQAHDMLRVQLGCLERYFQKMAMDRLPFETVDYAVQTWHGPQGKALMDVLAASFPREKRAAADRIVRVDKPLDRTGLPFTHVTKAIQAASDVYHTKQAMDGAYQRLEKAAEELRPFASAPSLPTEEPFSISLVKQAGIADATKDLIDKTVIKSKDSVQDASLDLEDPDHENELRKIQTQAMMNQMMTDEENPVSGHDPATVFDAFNQLSKLAPRTATQPLAMQALLTKKLSGHMEPFEVKDVNDVEKGVRNTHGSPLSVGLLDVPAFKPEEQDK